jgi:hypothetical protein
MLKTLVLHIFATFIKKFTFGQCKGNGAKDKNKKQRDFNTKEVTKL